VPIFPLPHFPPLQNRADVSTPAFSTHAKSCRCFHSRLFHPCIFDRADFSTPAFSVAPICKFSISFVRKPSPKQILTQNGHSRSFKVIYFGIIEEPLRGALNLQDLKMTDQKRSKTGKCRTWKMTDQIAVLVLENVYFYSGDNSFTDALSSKFTGTKCVFFCCSQTLNIIFRRGRQTNAKTHSHSY